jgi:Leucine-rich repeat (LRR) protein
MTAIGNCGVGRAAAADRQRFGGGAAIRIAAGCSVGLAAAWIGRHTRLEMLYLQYTNTSDDGLKNLEGLPKLFYLDLNSTAITDRSIAHLTKLTALKELYLRGTKISPAGLAQLQEALPNCKIEASVAK